MLAKQLQISQEEIKKNEDVLMDFQFAFLTQNLKRIGYLLSPKGTFFGKQSLTFAKGKNAIEVANADDLIAAL